jgi:hypothetical protein
LDKELIQSIKHLLNSTGSINAKTFPKTSCEGIPSAQTQADGVQSPEAETLRGMKCVLRVFLCRVSRFGDSAQTQADGVQSPEAETLRGTKKKLSDVISLLRKHEIKNAFTFWLGCR